VETVYSRRGRNARKLENGFSAFVVVPADDARGARAPVRLFDVIAANAVLHRAWSTRRSMRT